MSAPTSNTLFNTDDRVTLTKEFHPPYGSPRKVGEAGIIIRPYSTGYRADNPSGWAYAVRWDIGGSSNFNVPESYLTREASK